MAKKKKPILHINPPPQDRKCECCGIHMSKLKPFGGAGDPLVGDFKGSLLIKTFRAMANNKIDKIWNTKGMWIKGKKLTKAEKTEYEVLGDKQKVPELNYKKEIIKGCHTIHIKLLSKTKQKRFKVLDKKHYDSFSHLDEDKFIKKYGKKELESYYFRDQLENTVEASWECRECIILDGDDFYNKRNELWKRRQEENAKKGK